jgi:O-antigen ligase
LLSAAAVPLDPRSPRRALVLVGGLVAGTLLGLALVAVLEWRDRRVRRPVDLLMLPAGAVVPLLGMTSRWTPPPQSVMARARQLPTLPDQAARA